MFRRITLFLLELGLFLAAYGQESQKFNRWSEEKANAWYAQQGWLVGCNYIPSTAINQLEMWQAETFDSQTIDRGLSWAEDLGFNTARVYLHHLAWQIDPQGFKARMNKYLNIANKHGIKTLFVFFDDCWSPEYHAGKQPEPKTGIHNSGWVRDPGNRLFKHPKLMDTLKVYVTDILKTFGNDKRILAWDLYNEPGNSGLGDKSMPLLKNVFIWAREVNPSQPVTSGVWNPSLKQYNRFQLSHSDIITYHNYENEKKHKAAIDTLKKYHRPMICTEYMARPRNSRFQNILPLLKENNIGAINWGFVAGKTNTIYAWDKPMPDGSEPKIWFHDILRKDGSPYNPAEIELIKSLTGKK